MKGLKKKNGTYWWVAPTYGLANKGWKILMRDVSRNAFANIQRELEIEFRHAANEPSKIAGIEIEPIQ